MPASFLSGQTFASLPPKRKRTTNNDRLVRMNVTRQIAPSEAAATTGIKRHQWSLAPQPSRFLGIKPLFDALSADIKCLMINHEKVSVGFS